MNKELILKYKDEFYHWLNEGKCLYKVKDYPNTWYTNVDTLFAAGELRHTIAVVINDEYVEFRKALAEGKTLQQNVGSAGEESWKDCCSNPSFNMNINHYRVKPGSEFNIGDWVHMKVTLKNGSTTYTLAKTTTKSSCKPIKRPKNWHILHQDLKDAYPWKPKLNDYCWHEEHGLLKVAKHIQDEEYYANVVFRGYSTTVELSSLESVLELPTFLKEQ